MIRPARRADRDALRALWQICFDDPPEFVDWFFDERFRPEDCLTQEEDGKIVSCAHLYFTNLFLSGVSLPGAIMGGVATLPAFRGQGRMRSVVLSCLREARARGAAIVVQHPVDPAIYRSVGFSVFSQTLYARRASGYPGRAGGCHLAAPEGCMPRLFACYQAFARQYSGATDRTAETFARKWRDMRACRAQCLVRDAGDGYIFFYPEDGGLYGDECAALSPEAFGAMFDEMCRLYPEKSVRLRLPSDIRPEDADCVLAPHGAAAITDAGKIITHLKLFRGNTAISDPILPENEGVYDETGTKTSEKANAAYTVRELLPLAMTAEKPDANDSRAPLAGKYTGCLTDEY